MCGFIKSIKRLFQWKKNAKYHIGQEVVTSFGGDGVKMTIDKVSYDDDTKEFVYYNKNRNIHFRDEDVIMFF